MNRLQLKSLRTIRLLNAKIVFLIIACFLGVHNCQDSDGVNFRDLGIVINEINYNSSESFDPKDWIEIFNNTSEALDISTWSIKDEDNEHIFILPLNTTILPDEFLVICKDTSSFLLNFPEVVKYVGNMDFGLGNGGDIVRLFDLNGSLVDIVDYQDEYPWPDSADGGGPTLELINPNFDNSKSENWFPSENFGTPGHINSSYAMGE